MLVSLDPLAPAAILAGVVHVHRHAAPQEPPVCSLWTQALDWVCRDHRLRLQVLAVEPVALPEAEPSEPVVGAIARLERALRGTGGLLMLLNPAEAIGSEHISLAHGVRLFSIAAAEDEACWDAALSLAQPVYGLRGSLACDCMSAHPGAVISALAYGNFTCEDGLTLSGLEEDRSGVAYRIAAPDEDIEAAVIVRGGFEAGRLRGAAARWDDRGTEGYVRLVIRSPRGACWTQPRFVAPRADAPPHPHHHHAR